MGYQPGYEVSMTPSPRSRGCRFLPGIVFAARFILPALIYFLAATAAAWPQQSVEQSQPTRPVHIVLRGVNPESPLPWTHLSYYGGPVVSNLQVVVVFWGPDVYPPVTDGIADFFRNITNSAYFDLLSEYDTNLTPVGGGTGTNQSIGRGTYGGSFTITPSVCNLTPCTITDDQVQAELLSQLTAAQLPIPELDINGNVNTLYMIYFPPGVSIQLGNISSCNEFCAYHSTIIAAFNSKNLAYGVMPDFSPPDGCRQGCGSGTDFENITAVSSHEIAEVVTDADAGLTSLYSSPLAWIDSAFGTGEIGDICDHDDSAVSTPGGTFAVQLLWSNQLSACVTVGSHPSLQLNVPGTVTPGVSFNSVVTVENPADASTDISFSGTVHFTSSDSRAVLPPDSGFTPTDKGTQRFNVTLKTLGTQTITATDTINNAIVGTASVVVAGAVLTVTPSLNFGNQPIGTTSLIKVVTLTNNSAGTISITSMGITGADSGDFAETSTTCGSTILVNNFCIVSLTFTPGALGARSATLIITDDAGNSPQQTALLGTGIMQVTLTPTAISFATTKVGKTSTAKVIQVKNNLNMTVTFSGTPFTSTGANPGDFTQSATTCGSTLAAYGHCTVSITFTPAAKGARVATLNISDSGNPNPQTAALSGTGK